MTEIFIGLLFCSAAIFLGIYARQKAWTPVKFFTYLLILVLSEMGIAVILFFLGWWK